jgi:hypothetical protein
MPESHYLTLLNLSPDERLNPPKTVGKLKTIQEWASAAVDAVKDSADFLSALKALSPWAEAIFSSAKDVLPPLKFVVKLLDELTKIQDPEQLARLACTLAYQSAAEKAIAKIGAPARAVLSGPKFDDAVDEVDFANFTLDNAVNHPFVTKADRILQHYLPQAGFSDPQVDRIIAEIHQLLPGELETLITNGKTKEKFDPLHRWLSLSSDGRLSAAALRRHADYVSWLFNRAPVMQTEPYALSDVYLPAECSKLTHGVLKKGTPGEAAPNPFEEGQNNGGRHPLLETVMEYIADPKFREPIVIQGSAGSGKSTFTLRLSDHLRNEGLRPIRIRLRDVVLGKEFYLQFGDALNYEDDAYLRTHEHFTAPHDPLRGGAIFQEVLRYGKAPICPYVLILDGWDEISIAVAEGFRQRVRDLLLNIRRELLRPDRPMVRVILTGRPSDAIDECTDFFHDATPMLTVRILSPEQLDLYADKLRSATTRKPLHIEGAADWTFPEDEVLEPVFQQYEEAFRNRDTENPGVAAVLGYPLLLHYTFRLLAEKNVNRKELIESPTALFRKLTDYATWNANLPSDRQAGRTILPRLSGSDLRILLRRTAAHMTALGLENIGRGELERRLKTTDLTQTIKSLSKESVISTLLISFYFKGGNAALGCEFTHKAFREYLFAEETVEAMKNAARDIKNDLAERPDSLYWKDFDAGDPRRKASEELATLLAPQWLTAEVVRHLGSLLEWEVRRTFSSSDIPVEEGATTPCTREEWFRIRTLLADLWDWWGDGVHMRPQPREREDSVGIDWSEKSLAERMVPKCRPLTATTLAELGEPVRTVTLDAHLGDAVFRLNAWVHWYLQRHSGEESAREERRSQGIANGKIRFRPTCKNPEYFSFFCSRITGAGWRPEGEFPQRIFGRGIDLEDTTLSFINFYHADLEESSLRNSPVFGCCFQDANLTNCSLEDASVIQTDFVFACLDGSNFTDASLWGNQFNGASLRGASFSGASFSGVGDSVSWDSSDDRSTPVPPNDFTDARGIKLPNRLLPRKKKPRPSKPNPTSS